MLNFVGLGHSHIVALAKGAYALEAKQADIAGHTIRGRFRYLYDAACTPAFLDAARTMLNPAIATALTEGAPRFLWDGSGDNPYPAFLAHADLFVVTGDSVEIPALGIHERCGQRQPAADDHQPVQPQVRQVRRPEHAGHVAREATDHARVVEGEHSDAELRQGCQRRL